MCGTDPFLTPTMPIPLPPPLDPYIPYLSRMMADTSLLPNPHVVAAIPSAVFPTTRQRTGHHRLTQILDAGNPVGMYDDNATPEWALFWAHALDGSRPDGWTIAHVWPACDDINCYTHLANLLLVPEPLASLTDKNGPATTFLRWHAWSIYRWKPPAEPAPIEPAGYGQVHWHYLNAVDNPSELIRQEFSAGTTSAPGSSAQLWSAGECCECAILTPVSFLLFNYSPHERSRD